MSNAISIDIKEEIVNIFEKAIVICDKNKFSYDCVVRMKAEMYPSIVIPVSTEISFSLIDYCYPETEEYWDDDE